MNKRDWFFVGVRLFGVWVLLDGVTEARYLIEIVFSLTPPGQDADRRVRAAPGCGRGRRLLPAGGCARARRVCLLLPPGRHPVPVLRLQSQGKYERHLPRVRRPHPHSAYWDTSRLRRENL